jgi:hypothetical protein
VTTLVGDTTKAGQKGILYMGFVQAAVYDAVVGVEGRYQPYRFHARAPHGTSAQAAAVAAAHKVLVTYCRRPRPAWTRPTPRRWRGFPTGGPRPVASPSAHAQPTT